DFTHAPQQLCGNLLISCFELGRAGEPADAGPDQGRSIRHTPNQPTPGRIRVAEPLAEHIQPYARRNADDKRVAQEAPRLSDNIAHHLWLDGVNPYGTFA